MDLIPDQCVDAVTLCESFHQVVFVLPDPLDKVRGNAGVQGSIAFAGHDIYARLIHVLNLLDCGFNHAAMTATWLCERTSPRSDSIRGPVG